MTILAMDKCFEAYHNRYKIMLEKYYPAHGSTGFTERNQSTNFAEAIKTIYPSSFTWYEAPIGERSREHIDAVVFLPEINSIVLIESKRFSNPDQKLYSMLKDILRLCDKQTAESICKGLEGNYKKCGENIFGVILADVWQETKKKRLIYESWGEQFFEFHDFYEDSRAAIKETKNNEWFKDGFDYHPYCKEYKLLALAFRIA